VRHARRLLVEAWRDLSARDAVLAAVLALVVAAVASAGASALLAALTYEAELSRAGVYVWSARPIDFFSTLPWRDCVHAELIDGVKASGGFAHPRSAEYRFAGLPSPVEAMPTTEGALWAWGLDETKPTPAREGPRRYSDNALWAGGDLVNLLNLGLGARVEAVAGDTLRPVGSVERVAPAWLPSATLQSSVIVPAPPVGLSECWLRLERWSADSADDIIQAVFGSKIVDVSRHRLPPVGPTTVERYAADVARAPWPILAGMLLLVAAGIGWSERSHSAVYRALGVSPAGLWWMRVVQAFATAPFAVVAALVGMTAPFMIEGSGIAPWSLPQLLRGPILIICCWLTLAPVVRLLAAMTNIQTALQDR